MRSLGTGWLAVLLLTLGALGATSCSTDEICSKACRAWEDKCGYSDYTYDICFRDCKDEGDWSQGYADCCARAGTCWAVEDCQL